MSSSRKGAAEFPTSSPFWSKSYAEFVMEKELKEAKAAVEECFRRRAKRAGLEGMLPVGRPMTERELDMLGRHWETGPGAGPSGGRRWRR